MATKFNYRPYLGPRYWPVWLILGLLRALTWLPYGVLMKLGGGIGQLTWWLMPKRRHIVTANIRLVFPHLPADEQHRLIRRTFSSLGKSLFEMALAWWGSRNKLAPLVKVNGLEHLQAALAEGKGVILLSAHFSSLELGGRLLAFKQPIQVTYKRSREPLMEALLQHNRKTHFIDAINTYDTRAMVKGLKKGHATWYAMDQDFGMKQSVFAPFMGVQTATLTTPARLARMSGALVVPYFPRRLEDDSGYELTILPALDNFPSGDEVADASRVNALIAEQVYKAPEQYLWAHRRFKTRPEGEPPVYQR